MRNRVKVLMIAPTPFFADRGCHARIYEEIRALSKLGYEIVLCTYGLGRDVPGVRIVRTINMPWYKKLSAGPSYTKILLLPCLTWTVIRTIVSFRPDIVHAHLHEGALIIRICKILFPSKKYVFDMQGSLTGETIQHGFVKIGSAGFRFLAWLERRVSGWFPVITQSDSMVEELRRLGVPGNRITNVKDGVDTDMFCPMRADRTLATMLGISLERPRVLYMGLLEHYQGVDLMLEAFRMVAQKCPAIQFIIIGYPNIDMYKAMCRDYGILDQVLFLGRIDYLKLPLYLSLSDIAIAPKIAEAEGDGKIYNYMAMGMLTIAFHRSVSREILGDCGIYAEFGNPESLAQKIVWALESPDQVKILGQKARQRAIDTLSWNAVGRRIHEVYAKQ